MKKTLVSLATASLIASTAMAADKGIDFVTTGQTTIYYETTDNGNVANSDDSLFGRSSSKANFGVQLNIDADLKNGFTFGSQLTYLDALGLNKNLVGDTNVAQVGGSVPNTQTLGATKTTDDLALTKIFVAKKIANTTIKLGRQELPKSLSPFAFSEGWNVYKNTFEAALVVNSDIPKTTLVGAYVGGGDNSSDLSAMDDLKVAGVDVAGTAYMLTAQTTAVPMATITASYYTLSKIQTSDLGAGIPNTGASVIWVDAKIAAKSLPAGLTVGIQGGTINPDEGAFKDTTAMGLKVGLKPMDALQLCLAYTTVDDGTVAMQNTGGVKTPLYTQMVKNQNNIKSDNDSLMIKAAYSLGGNGKVIFQATSSTDNSAAKNDATDIELIYKVKVGEVNLLAALFNTKMSNDDSAKNYVRLVARYNF